MRYTAKPTLFYISTILSIVIFLFPEKSTAGIFDAPITDKSIEYLGMIFGGSVGKLNLGLDPESTTFLSHLFQLFNGIILGIAIFILAYVGIISTVNTAQEGQVMGKKWSSVWIPLRSAVGLLLLAPMPGTGYSFLQVTIMWIVLHGVGAADHIWNFVLNNMASGISATRSIKIDEDTKNRLLRNGKDIGKNLLNNLICIEAIKKANPNQTLNAPLQYKFVNKNFTPGDSPKITEELIFGSDDPKHPSRKNICGSIIIEASLTADDLKDDQNKNIDLSPEQKNSIVEKAYQNKKQALTLMIAKIIPIAKTIAGCDKDASTGDIILPEYLQASSSFATGILREPVIIYQKYMSQLIKQKFIPDQVNVNNNSPSQALVPWGEGKVHDQIINSGQAIGWLSAGSFYYLFNKSTQQKLLDTTTDKPILVDPFDSDDFGNSILTAGLGVSTTFSHYFKYGRSSNSNNFFQKPPEYNLTKIAEDHLKPNPTTSGFDPVKNFNTDKLHKDLQAPIEDFKKLAKDPDLKIDGKKKEFTQEISKIIKSLASVIRSNLINKDQPDPLVSQATFGINLMNLTEDIWVTIFASPFIPNLAKSFAAKSDDYLNMFTFAIGLAPAILAIIGVLWGIGAGLAIYTPLVPYMMFMITALSWFALVIEAIVAAPIVALGFVSPAQDELGKVVPALGIIVNIFLRPTLMIIGLIFGAKLYKATISMVNIGFDFSFISLQNQTGTSLLSGLVIMVLYFGFILTLVNKCYALIYQLPDKILRWIGVTGEPTDVSSIKETQHSFDQSSKQISQPAEGAATSAANKLKTSIEDIKKGPKDPNNNNNQQSGS